MTTTENGLTGNPSIYFDWREVWPDQIDDLGTDCPFCQLVDQQVECNVYVPDDRSDRHVTCYGSCRRCVAAVALDNPHLDPSRDVVVEYAKEEK